ncbi:response regulator [candidate division KSB3 bacterium]|uniref:Response regulator n=1 Tax=candidate division KSB3 bacterium TaxID=2044937 RepID=A0A9D5Q650_9BACT|nr:response regulator [candidate division KSB3 bacterium]MBD3324541.1 response regulator [candidate division KSB3 bacterium]
MDDSWGQSRDAPHVIKVHEIFMKNVRVLVVEDSRTMQTFLQNLLRQEDYDVAVAKDGETGIALFQQGIVDGKPFDIVMTDVVMPGLSGLDLLKKVKTLNHDTVVVVLTSDATVETAIEALNLGANNFLHKPPNTEEILNVLWRATKQREIFFENEELNPFTERTIHIDIPSHLKFIKGISHNIIADAKLMGYDEQELRDKIPVTIDEAVTNAIKHGNKFQEDKRVEINVSINTERIKIVVADEGDGFDVSQVPDPTDPKNFLKPSGRGILFMTIGMDEIQYNEKGNILTLITYKVPPDQEATTS